MELQMFGEAVCSFISAIYKSGWDTLPVDEYNNSIRKFIASKFTSKSLKIKVGSTSGNFKEKAVEIIKLPLLSLYAHLRKFWKNQNFLVKVKNLQQ